MNATYTDVVRCLKIRDAEESRIASTPSDKLLEECLERLIPILTHKRPVSYMSIPVDFERDDDVFICERLREVKRRLTTGSGGNEHE